MRVELLPLLQVQRDLLDEQRGPARFQSYLKAMIGRDGEPVLPLAAFNPMGKAHVAQVLDELIAMNAETIAGEAMRESAKRLAGVAALAGMPACKFGLVVADDALGGWTNRYLFEAKDRFENKYGIRKGFITALMWSSEVPSPNAIRTETAASIFRAAWTWVFGLPETLGEMLKQEGMCARFAGVSAGAKCDEEQVVFMRARLESTDYPTLMASLYGDDAAEKLGYPRIGMEAGVGMRFAVSDEFAGRLGPVDALIELSLQVEKQDCE